MAIGLMSGTSADGIGAALVAIRGNGLRTRAKLLAFETTPYPPAVRQLIAKVSQPPGGTVDLVCRANILLGELFAEAALRVAKLAGVPIGRVALIGSHGQTIHHLPGPARVAGRRVTGTLQIGEPSVIAERTGVTTVADFRPRDMACGGQGAPLVPHADFLLFRHRTRSRLLLNLGGIANVTHLPPACRLTDVLAFDTGPANMLLDALARTFTNGRLSCDRDGALAAAGTVNGPLLRRLLRHPFLRKQPPKSTGREQFGADFLLKALAWSSGGPQADILATFTAFTAASIRDAYGRFVQPRGAVAEVIASGGGCHNPTLMAHLAERFAPIPVRTTEEFGIPVDAKEAVAFAILAHETLAGRPANVPSATGARRRALLGKIIPGRRLPW